MQEQSKWSVQRDNNVHLVRLYNQNENGGDGIPLFLTIIQLQSINFFLLSFSIWINYSSISTYYSAITLHEMNSFNWRRFISIVLSTTFCPTNYYLKNQTRNNNKLVTLKRNIFSYRKMKTKSVKTKLFFSLEEQHMNINISYEKKNQHQQCVGRECYVERMVIKTVELIWITLVWKDEMNEVWVIFTQSSDRVLFVFHM